MKNVDKTSNKVQFIIKYGIIRFGLLSGITYMILLELLNNNFNLKDFKVKNIISLNSIVGFLLFLIGGYFWGLFMWTALKRKQKN